MKRYLIIIAVLALLMPGVLLAQDDLTLQGLAEVIADVVEEVADLAEQLTALASRVTAIEESLTPAVTGDGVCVQYSRQQLQRETITAYLDAFDEDIENSRISLQSVRYDTESGLTSYHFKIVFDDRFVVENWDGCDFAGHSEWEEEE